MQYLPSNDFYYEEQIKYLSYSENTNKDYLHIYEIENSDIIFYYPICLNDYNAIIPKNIKPPESNPGFIISIYLEVVTAVLDKKKYFIEFLQKQEHCTSKKKCDLCKKFISDSNWSKHIRTKKHLKKLN